jgi:hypothetical protein
MTAEINSIPKTCYINQCTREIRKGPTSSRCSMMSIVEHFDPKLYTYDKFSKNKKKQAYGGNIKRLAH